jgi:hypothetical protein
VEFLLVIGLIVLIYVIMPKPEAAKPIGTSEKLVIEKKKCPPHQWFWQEIVDQNGDKQGERIVCKICGPLSKSLNGSEE